MSSAVCPLQARAYAFKQLGEKPPPSGGSSGGNAGGSGSCGGGGGGGAGAGELLFLAVAAAAVICIICVSLNDATRMIGISLIARCGKTHLLV